MNSMETVFGYVQQALENHERTCLTCMHYKTSESGMYLRCAIRPCTYVPVIDFSDKDAALASRRAKKCRYWEPDDD